VKSTAPTFPAGEWIAVEIEVRGNEEIIHRVRGEDVLRFEKPTLDPNDEKFGAQDLIKAGQPLVIDSGHIALQAEGQGVWFRNIEIKLLEP
jgi:hypothetical protein